MADVNTRAIERKLDRIQDTGFRKSSRAASARQGNASQAANNSKGAA